MKNLVLLLVFSLCVLSSYAVSTDASRYAEKEYGKQTGNPKVRINVKKEHTVEYQQKIGDKVIPAITYGYGDMKAQKMRKTRITYICLLDEDCNPMWSYIVPSK